MSTPTVHQMILRLEKSGLINRQPGTPRSIKVLVSPERLPYLLDKDESDILNSFDKGEWKKIPGMEKEIKHHVEYAKA